MSGCLAGFSEKICLTISTIHKLVADDRLQPQGTRHSTIRETSTSRIPNSSTRSPQDLDLLPRLNKTSEVNVTAAYPAIYGVGVELVDGTPDIYVT
jgi:hypothetical protein